MASMAARHDLTEGVVWKKLLGFFFPILLGLLFQQLYNTVDAVIVGRFEGDSALAAVGGGAATIINMIIGFCTGLNSGATVIVAQTYGSGDHDTLSRVLHTSIVFCAIIGLIVTIAGYFAAPALLRLIRNPEDIMDSSVLYLRIYLVGAIPMLLYNLFQGALQAVGDSARPLRYLITSCLVNIVLDTVFVAVLRMGVAGVGWASVISMCCSAVLALTHLLRVNAPHRVEVKKLRMDFGVLRRAMRIGLPSGVQGSMYNIANVIIQASVNGFGTGIVAAWAATGKLDGFYWVTSNAFGLAICAFVGQCYGAGKIDRMREAIRVCTKIALGVSFGFSILLLGVSRPAYHLFLQDPQVIDDAVRIMWYFVPFYFTWTFIEVLSGTFRGVGDTLCPMIIVMLGTCVFRVLWILIVVPLWHTIFAVAIVYAISWAITGAVFIWYYKKGYWLKGNL